MNNDKKLIDIIGLAIKVNNVEEIEQIIEILNAFKIPYFINFDSVEFINDDGYIVIYNERKAALETLELGFEIDKYITISLDKFINNFSARKRFELIRIIQQHEIKITCPTHIIPDPYIVDKLVDDINDELTQINDSGTVTFNQLEYDWEIVEPKSYLDTKVEILEEKGEVVFEHNCMVYTISESCEGGYEINMFDLHSNNFISEIL